MPSQFTRELAEKTISLIRGYNEMAGTVAILPEVDATAELIDRELEQVRVLFGKSQVALLFAGESLRETHPLIAQDLIGLKVELTETLRRLEKE